MTKLRDRMMGELQLRNYSEHTIYSYIGAVERFARHFGKSPTELGADHVKQFLLFLKNEKKVVWQTVQANRAALRFLYVSVLKQKWFEEEIPPPIRRPILPTVLSAQEITRMLGPHHKPEALDNHCALLRHRTASERTEDAQVEDIEGERKVLHVRKGKGLVPRDIGLSDPLLERLRVYWRWRKPKHWLFPSKQRAGSCDGRQINSSCMSICCPSCRHSQKSQPSRFSTQLRHTYARSRGRSADHPVLLGHRDIQTTARYLRVSAHRIHAAVSSTLFRSSPSRLQRITAGRSDRTSA